MVRKCFVCGEINEKLLEESHDVPCNLFWMFAETRRERKQLADPYGRHMLCKKHHEEFEKAISEYLILKAKEFARRTFNG